MSNPRKTIATLLIGGIGGFMAVSIMLPFFVKYNIAGMAVIFNKLVLPSQTVEPKVEASAIGAQKQNDFSFAIDKVEPSIVALQSFSGNNLTRSGSGIILTQDGLIGTINSLVPSVITYVQVIKDNKIYSGKIIFRSYNKNLALISISESNLRAIELKPKMPDLGQELLVFAKTISFGKDMPLVARAAVSQADGNAGLFKVHIAYDQFLFGSALVDDEGNFLGLVDFRNQKPIVITPKTIEEIVSLALTNGR